MKKLDGKKILLVCIAIVIAVITPRGFVLFVAWKLAKWFMRDQIIEVQLEWQIETRWGTISPPLGKAVLIGPSGKIVLFLNPIGAIVLAKELWFRRENKGLRSLLFERIEWE